MDIDSLLRLKHTLPKPIPIIQTNELLVNTIIVSVDEDDTEYDNNEEYDGYVVVN